jgi:hypothetical protein
VDGYGDDEGKVHCRTRDIPCGPGEMSRFRRAPKTMTYSYREYPGAREWTETVHDKDCQCEECVADREEPAPDQPVVS